MRVEPVDHLLQQIAPDLRYTRGGVEVCEMSLRESKVTVKAVEENLERVLQRLKMMLSRGISFRPHSCFGFEPEVATVSVASRKTTDLELVLKSRSRGQASTRAEAASTSPAHGNAIRSALEETGASWIKNFGKSEK